MYHQADETPEPRTEFDTLIIGAGISGIGMGCHLARRLPGMSFAILEARDGIGGTWDLFRYPGIRSDSDLYTFGFDFKPWDKDNQLAGADEIVDYLREAADEHDVTSRIRFGHKVLGASWSSAEARWTVRVEVGGEERELKTRFLFGGTGYYDYEQGFRPTFEGEENFSGQIIHPQQWPEDLDYEGKRVVVIGSGATAVTLIPAMADRTEHITMLQRSPSYILPIPGKNPITNGARRILPRRIADKTIREAYILLWRYSFRFFRWAPRFNRQLLRGIAKLMLPKDYPVDVDFKPSYDPWDERMCVVPDGDLFKAISNGKASVVTDRIKRFSSDGIELESGQKLEADIVVAATGLNMLAFAGIELEVDGEKIDPSEEVVFRTMLLSGVPNFAFTFGYTNISWTLKCALVGEHFCRLVEYLEASGKDSFTPEYDGDGNEIIGSILGEDFQSGYIRRGSPGFPRRAASGPWQFSMDFASDRKMLLEGPVTHPALKLRTTEQEKALS